jgi:hypothetical protein
MTPIRPRRRGLLPLVSYAVLVAWRAFVDGKETPILPANAIMRAVPLSPDAKFVVMAYQPFARSTWALFLYLLGGVLFALGLLLAVWAQNIRRSHVALCNGSMAPPLD